MTQPCTGKERHSHYVLADNKVFYHTHDHTQNVKEFNRLHHHAPVEHDNCTLLELENEAEYVEIPF